MADLRLPISVKGVLIEAGAVVLLRNERAEWELPGGRLEPGESPVQCVAREFEEELGAAVQAGPLLDAWVYEPLPGRQVFVLAYAVFRAGREPLRHSEEHDAMRWTPLGRLADIALPDGYRRAIRLCAGLPAADFRPRPEARPTGRSP